MHQEITYNFPVRIVICITVNHNPEEKYLHLFVSKNTQSYPNVLFLKMTCVILKDDMGYLEDVWCYFKR